ncbi:CD225/dispanin family protein [Amycolatopsis sp. cg5]|uniref:CD225/dispanin family protein n=1 Tax=Amycolatopsis sp. cg5 TaxID=3238802 RepID=UPI00352620DD
MSEQGGYPPPMYTPPPDNNMVWAILSTLMCCLPLGIVSIIKANQVQGLWFSGQHAAARQAADEAKKWAIWSAIVTGVLGVLVAIGIVVFAVILGLSFSDLPNQ